MTNTSTEERQQWEYEIDAYGELNFATQHKILITLAKRGNGGWELCSTQVVHSNLTFYIFKLPITTKP
jgi:hypothetical protein